nr:MAG TPA: hypothetical protein [Caudoviricetes sp.]
MKLIVKFLINGVMFLSLIALLKASVSTDSTFECFLLVVAFVLVYICYMCQTYVLVERLQK